MTNPPDPAAQMPEDHFAVIETALNVGMNDYHAPVTSYQSELQHKFKKALSSLAALRKDAGGVEYHGIEINVDPTMPPDVFEFRKADVHPALVSDALAWTGIALFDSAGNKMPSPVLDTIRKALAQRLQAVPDGADESERLRGCLGTPSQGLENGITNRI